MGKNHRHRGSGRHAFLSLSSVLAALVCLSISIITRTNAFLQTGFVVPIYKTTTVSTSATRINSSSSSSGSGSGNNDENTDLLEKARLLREEASLMEDNLRAATPSATAKAVLVAPIVVNTKLEESIWTLSYRFSSQPIPEDDNNSKEPQKTTTFYSGKMNLLLKGDGYSEQIIAKGNGNDNNKQQNDIEILKIWGWDRETSNEDDLDYLLFSMDVKFPESDPELSNKKERYYFQARIDPDGNNIVLKDGTITVKKDVTEKTGGMWGLFNVAGILTQFRYCGDFVAKPSQ